MDSIKINWRGCFQTIGKKQHFILLKNVREDVRITSKDIFPTQNITLQMSLSKTFSYEKILKKKKCPSGQVDSSHFSDTSTLLCPPGPTARPSTAIGLCGRRQTPLAPSRVSWSSSETKLEERMAATEDTLANPDSQSRLQGVPGNLVRRDAVAMTPEMLPKHLHPLEIKGPRADASLHDSLAGAPHLRLAGSPTHLPTKKLIVTCSYPPSRPPPRFHTVCSQAPPRLRVNAHLY